MWFELLHLTAACAGVGRFVPDLPPIDLTRHAWNWCRCYQHMTLSKLCRNQYEFSTRKNISSTIYLDVFSWRTTVHQTGGRLYGPLDRRHGARGRSSRHQDCIRRRWRPGRRRQGWPSRQRWAQQWKKAPCPNACVVFGRRITIRNRNWRRPGSFSSVNRAKRLVQFRYVRCN